MIDNFNHIHGNIFMGQKIDSQEFCDKLTGLGVTHVINLWSGIPEPFYKGDVLTLNQEDDGTPRPPDQMWEAIQYANANKEAGELYIHCQWGLGRAPSMTYAILRARGISPAEATSIINTRRPRCAGHWEHYISSIENNLTSIHTK